MPHFAAMGVRNFFSTLRVVRHYDHVGGDLVPDASVLLDVPDDVRLAAAVVSARGGDWRPAAAVLAANRSGPDWDARGEQAAALAAAAIEDDAWLREWLREQPGDPDALLVRATCAVEAAWRAHGWAGTAPRAPGDGSAEHFARFLELLEAAEPALKRACAANPPDPNPWCLRLRHAVGTGASRAEFDRLWFEAVSRARHHAGAHAAALLYLSARWHGSHDEMFAFAERGAAGASERSPLALLPLQAELEFAVSGTGGPRAWRRPQALEATDRLLALLPPRGPALLADPWPARNLLACLLTRQERYEEALDQFRAIGGHATRYPWAYFGEPRAAFLSARDDTRMFLAAQIPLLRPPGG
ncbi:hypothetical protein [Allostreptomyces psammosilenae]|uniref:Tetratricopeptide (TPR) repeat protein n=1 Tax=Allostreptomyces psammosilenae TaxID=1892865 RepID=A0A852ZUI5_9ACTN|nr:hypothetical protein [Allostreptomyces psammosilenae]NYI04434.1 tetratricopeptide (TPR) repeat protein [Allostreptomyces psammosilenae]